MTTYTRQRPDFVILGMPLPEHNQFMVWASDSLTHAELDMQTEYVASFTGRTAPVYERIELTVGMHKIIRIIANSYGECLMKLFNTWQPRQDRRPDGIEQATYQLPRQPKELNG